MAHFLTLRVYYEDTDLAGIVYYANYLKFIERGRSEALRAAGIDQLAMARSEQAFFVVRRVEIDYRRPARFDDVLRVRTQVIKSGRASIDLAQDVLRDDQTLVESRVRLALVGDDGRPKAFSPELKSALDRLTEN